MDVVKVDVDLVKVDALVLQKNTARIELEMQELRKGQQAAIDAITHVRIAVVTTNGELESLARVGGIKDNAADYIVLSSVSGQERHIPIADLSRNGPANDPGPLDPIASTEAPSAAASE